MCGDLKELGDSTTEVRVTSCGHLTLDTIERAETWPQVPRSPFPAAARGLTATSKAHKSWEAESDSLRMCRTRGSRCLSVASEPQCSLLSLLQDPPSTILSPTFCFFSLKLLSASVFLHSSSCFPLLSPWAASLCDLCLRPFLFCPYALRSVPHTGSYLLTLLFSTFPSHPERGQGRPVDGPQPAARPEPRFHHTGGPPPDQASFPVTPRSWGELLLFLAHLSSSQACTWRLDKGRRAENLASSETHPSLCLPPHSWPLCMAFCPHACPFSPSRPSPGSLCSIPNGLSPGSVSAHFRGQHLCSPPSSFLLPKYL